MPPRIPVRFPWASPAPIAPSSTSLCLRTFTSTPPSLALGPESPNYIEVPKPVQPTFPPKPVIKGVLPTPRDVFKTRSHLPKHSKEFLAQATREPEKVQEPGPFDRDAELRLYKRQLADTRRRALREGVKQLHARTTRTEAHKTKATKKLQADNRRRALAPPLRTDVLTSTTVSKTLQDYLSDKVPSTKNTPAAMQGRRTAFQRRMATHAAKRQAHLHDLYTHARDFIVDEEQLDDAIEKAFGTDETPVGFGNRAGEEGPEYDGKSVWDAGVPDGVTDRLQRLKTGEGVSLAKERMRRVAEELTGGRM